MVKVLVTGGAGFIGSNYVRHALAAHADWHVTNLPPLDSHHAVHERRPVDPAYAA